MLKSIPTSKGGQMRTILWCGALAALLTGCTTKEQSKLLTDYEKRKQYHKTLMQTEKVQLYEGNLTKVALTATYLNRSQKAHTATEDEHFIIGLYVDDEEMADAPVFDFSLTLNGQAPKEIKPISYDDPKLKQLSFVSDWNRFYLVTFPHVNKKRFKLVFESDMYGKGTLDFAKRAKYTFTKKAF
jgi:hypothetical protein